MEEFGFGVDIGGTTIKMGLFQGKQLLEKWEIPTNKKEKGRYILGEIARSLQDKIQEKGMEKKRIIGIGLGVPGPVDANGIVNGCVNLGWDKVPVEKELSQLTGIRVKAGNDANVAALGEMWQGGAKGSTNVIMVTLGTGVGGGVIVNKRLVAGHHGAGGEIGHITVNPEETEPCNCGRYGCLEQYASATGIVRMAKRKLEKSKTETSLRGFDPLTAKDIFEEAKKGDILAGELVEELGEILGSALSNICCIADPQVVVIGGGVSKAGKILTDVVQKHFTKTVFHACRDTKFELATLGNDAGIYGSMRLIME